MKKQTAVEFLGHELNVKLFYDISPELWQQVNEIFKQAKAMEKEQIVHCYEQAYRDGYIDNGKSGEAYYNETYGGDMSKQEEPKQYTNEELEGFEDFKSFIIQKQEGGDE